MSGLLVKGVVQGEASLNILRIPQEMLCPGSQDEVPRVQDGQMISTRIQFVIDSVRFTVLFSQSWSSATWESWTF
ncbi:hypothetical protein [Pajaroellobacter abortibovis]|uniref:hypothetical protein n=1 Tax=Pajaroellobacter abortibovis TaxID=1882918 RepID=UPI0012EC6EAC|nr:hypothetical protein [Pajaroellobacter abortibovis]